MSTKGHYLIGWLVGCFGLNSHLRQYIRCQYFSLYPETVFQSILERGKKRKRNERQEKMSKQPPSAPTASTIGPCPTLIQICRRPGTGNLPSTIAPRPSGYYLNDLGITHVPDTIYSKKILKVLPSTGMSAI